MPYPASAVTACQPRERCNLIEGNEGNSPNGARLIQLVDANADLRNTRVLRNRVNEAGIFNVYGSSTLALINSVVAETQLRSFIWLFSLDGSNGAAPSIYMNHTTILQPAIAGVAPGLFINSAGVSSRLSLQNSVIHAPDTHADYLSLSFLPEQLALDHVLLPDIPSMVDGNPTLLGHRDPQFVSASELRLRPASPAVDFAPHNTGFPHDIDGNPRVDLPRAPNRFGLIDLGAFETQVDHGGSDVFLDGFEPREPSR